MVLALAYTADAEGKPVAWNETYWVDEEFSTLLKDAERTLDVEARREIMCKLEDIQMERGSVGIAFWTSVWYIANKRIKESTLIRPTTTSSGKPTSTKKRRNPNATSWGMWRGVPQHPSPHGLTGSIHRGWLMVRRRTVFDAQVTAMHDLSSAVWALWC
jgi:hypothetical protein